MHRDKYVYEFIVIMSSLIPGTQRERNIEVEAGLAVQDSGWSAGGGGCPEGRGMWKGGQGGGGAVEVGLFYWEFWRVVARICESRLFDSFQR